MFKIIPPPCYSLFFLCLSSSNLQPLISVNSLSLWKQKVCSWLLHRWWALIWKFCPSLRWRGAPLLPDAIMFLCNLSGNVVTKLHASETARLPLDKARLINICPTNCSLYNSSWLNPCFSLLYLEIHRFLNCWWGKGNLCVYWRYFCASAHLSMSVYEWVLNFIPNLRFIFLAKWFVELRIVLCL